jgi:hypothetical protein
MRYSQLVELADSDRNGLLFDLKAKALIGGKKDLLQKLDAIDGEGDTIELLGQLQLIGALPEIEPDGDSSPDNSGAMLPIELVFPADIVKMIKQTAAACQVTESHAAQDFRLALNALVGPSLRYEITPDWSRHCGLFFCIVGESGTGKSRTSRHFMAPVYALQKDITEAGESGRLTALVERQALEIDLEETQKKLRETHKVKRKSEVKSEADAATIKERIKELKAEIAKIEQSLIPPTIWETDVTTEYLLKVMVQNGGQVSIVGVETPLFGILVGRYTQGVIESVEIFNDAYDGMPVSAGRMKNKAKVVCDEPRLAVSVGTQPTVLYKTSNSSTLLERGTLARFSFFEPTNMIGHRDMGLRIIDPDVKAAYLDTMRDLAHTFRARPPIEGDLYRPMEPTVLQFSKNAVERFIQWRQLREAERMEGGRLRNLTGFQARIDDMLPRTAAQLHALWHGPQAPESYITEETIERAILITEFDIQTTERVFAKMGLDVIPDLADAIEEWARTGDVEETTIRKICRASIGMDKTADQVRAACRLLQDEGKATITKRQSRKGGRPSEAVVFNLPF